MLKRPTKVEFNFPQPPAPYPPSQRSGALIGPSGVGKTTTAIAMLMGPYRGVYSRVWVFSPSCAKGVDPAWDAWRKHVKEVMHVPDEEQTMWHTWEPEVLEKLIARHAKVNAHMKDQKRKRGFTALALVDDFADAGEKVMHSSTNVLTSLFVRGRHLGVACWLLTQKLRIVSLICRTNFCWMLVWRLRNAKERDQIFEELSALLPLRTLQAMYELATAEKHSFWYINLLNEREEMFFKNFDHRMVPSAGRMLPNSKGHEPLPTGQAAPQLPVPRAGAGA